MKKPSCTIKLDEVPGRHRHKLTDRNKVSERYPTFFNGDSISGSFILRLNSSPLKHKGIKVELHGIILKHGTITTTALEFLTDKQDISPPGEIYKEKTNYEFNFGNPDLRHESYKGNYTSVKYFIKVIIEANIFNSTYEKEFAVANPYEEEVLYKNDFPLRLRVGVKNTLSLSIEFEHSNYNCRGTLKGFVSFNLVNTDIKFMEIQLIRREIIFDGKKYEPEYIARYELVDGGPCKYERLPIRFFLKSYNLTPTYPDIEGIFGVKYFLNFVVVDAEDNRYFKLAEINLFRLFSDWKTHARNYDNNGLFISEPFFEDEYFYCPDSDNNRNIINENNNNEDFNYNEGNNYPNKNDYYGSNSNMRNLKFDNTDNNLVLNIPGEDYSNQDFDNNYLRNRNNNKNFNNNLNSNSNNRFDYESNNDDFRYRNIQNNNNRNFRNQGNNNYYKNKRIKDNRQNFNFNNKYNSDFEKNLEDDFYNENNINNNYSSNNNTNRQNRNRNNNYINNNQFEFNEDENLNNNINYIDENDNNYQEKNFNNNYNRNNNENKQNYSDERKQRNYQNRNYVNQNNIFEDDSYNYDKNKKNNQFTQFNNNMNKRNIFGNGDDFNEQPKQKKSEMFSNKNKSSIFGNEDDFEESDKNDNYININNNRKKNNIFGDDDNFNEINNNRTNNNKYEQNINNDIDYFDNRNNRGNYYLNKNFNNDLFQNNNKNNLNRNNVNQRRIINININNNINNSYNNRQNQSQKYQNNNIFNDYQRSDKGMNIRKKYNDNNVFEIDPLNNNNKNEKMPFNNRNKNLMNKRISNENDFNNIFGPS